MLGSHFRRIRPSGSRSGGRGWMNFAKATAKYQSNTEVSAGARSGRRANTTSNARRARRNRGSGFAGRFLSTFVK
jgi:hypothetical protein